MRCNTNASIFVGIYARVLYFVVRVRCRRKESSRSLSHLLMSFLFDCPVLSCPYTPLYSRSCA